MKHTENQVFELLAGKHALVTGGTRGIGAAVTRLLLGHGARVTALGRNAAASNTGPQTAKSDEVAHVFADVADFAAVTRAFQDARSRFGRIDIVVNNAGQATSAPFLKTDFQAWRGMMAVNLDGTFFCMQAALPDMLAAGWGRIVNIASTAGLVGYGYVSAYCAAKHGVVGLTPFVRATRTPTWSGKA
jgi:3-hydroxybutyrate dehydrogenase